MNTAASSYAELARESFMPQRGQIVEIVDMTAKLLGAALNQRG